MIANVIIRGTRALQACLLGAVLLGAGVAGAQTSVAVVGIFTDKAVLEIEGNRRVMSVGDISPEGVLLISSNSDEGVVLDIAGEIVTLGLDSGIGAVYAKPKTVQLRILPDTMGMYGIAGSINGRPVDFLVDTGATLVALNANTADHLGLDYLAQGTIGRSETASGFVRVYRLKLNSVQVGAIKINNVMAAVIDGEQPSRVLLGQSFLNKVSMQREGQVLVLEKKW